MGGPALTEADRERFLEYLEETANVSLACKLVPVSRRHAYVWRDEDPEFAARWAAAVDRGTDALEDEAIRRAHEGVAKPVFAKGVRSMDFILDENGDPKLGPDGKPLLRPAFVQEYSDTLLTFMLKARRPDKFKDRVASEVSGPGGGPITSATLVTDDPVEAARIYQRMIGGG